MLPYNHVLKRVHARAISTSEFSNKEGGRDPPNTEKIPILVNYG